MTSVIRIDTFITVADALILEAFDCVPFGHFKNLAQNDKVPIKIEKFICADGNMIARIHLRFQIDEWSGNTYTEDYRGDRFPKFAHLIDPIIESVLLKEKEEKEQKEQEAILQNSKYQELINEFNKWQEIADNFTEHRRQFCDCDDSDFQIGMLFQYGNKSTSIGEIDQNPLYKITKITKKTIVCIPMYGMLKSVWDSNKYDFALPEHQCKFRKIIATPIEGEKTKIFKKCNIMQCMTRNVDCVIKMNK